MREGGAAVNKRRNLVAATPFSQLLGLAPPALPVVASVSVVVAGQRITRVEQVDALVVDADRDDDVAIYEARRLAEQVRKAKRRANDKRYRESARAKEVRAAWMAANGDKMKQYRDDHRRRKGKAWAKEQAEDFQRRYWSDPEAARAKNRAYYHANRERILAAMRARREAQPQQERSA